jgi:DNA-binding MarR family transcriptional regulator
MTGAATGQTESARSESLSGIEHEIGILIRRVRRLIAERARVVHPDLQPAAYMMLTWLADQGPARASELVDVFHIDKAAVSRHLHQLCELGLTERHPDPDDGRASLMIVSDLARTSLKLLQAERRAWVDEQLADWSLDELDSVSAALARYNVALS